MSASFLVPENPGFRLACFSRRAHVFGQSGQVRICRLLATRRRVNRAAISPFGAAGCSVTRVHLRDGERFTWSEHGSRR